MKFSKIEQDSWLRWSAKKPEDAKICIMGIPFDNAVSLKKGASEGPKRIRELSVDMSDVTEDMIPVDEELLYDLGDIPVTLDWEAYFRQVEEEAYQLMQYEKFCIFIGGDHSVSIPLHRAFGRYQKEMKADARIGVIHFDAHYDLCSQYDGHRWSHACTEARALESVISGRDLTFVGIRVAELDELKTLEKNPAIKTIRAVDVYREGPQKVIQSLKERYQGYDALYVTLDIDVLDPACAPGTGTPVAGGLSSRELLEIIKGIFNSLPVKAMDIVEVAPPLDVNDITSWAALGIIHQIFGWFSQNK